MSGPSTASQVWTTSPDTDHGRWIDGIFPGVSLRDAVASFDASSRHWKGVRKDEYSIHSGLVPADYELPTGDGEFVAFESYSMGGRYEMGWVPDRSRSGADPIWAQHIVERWAQLVDAALRTSPDRSDRRASFIHYRDITLGAQPHSQWLVEQEARRAAESAQWDKLWKVSDAVRAQVWRLESELRLAEAELNTAVEAQFHVAETSVGVRAQRLRVEAAKTATTELEARLETARLAAAELDAQINEADDAVGAASLPALPSVDGWLATVEDGDG